MADDELDEDPHLLLGFHERLLDLTMPPYLWEVSSIAPRPDQNGVAWYAIPWWSKEDPPIGQIPDAWTSVGPSYTTKFPLRFRLEDAAIDDPVTSETEWQPERPVRIIVERRQGQLVMSRLTTLRDHLHGVAAIIRELGTSATTVSESRRSSVGADIEELVLLWRNLAADVSDDDIRRVGDAAAGLLIEISRSADPPKGLLRATLNWFGEKADLAADKFVEGAASTLGKTAGIAAGVGLTGQWSTVTTLVEKILSKL
jgi:hypothetical protein